MNYVAGRWLRLRTGEEDKGPDWKPCLSLSNTISKLFPIKEDADALLTHTHQAGADAALTRHVYLTLLDRVKSASAAAQPMSERGIGAATAAAATIGVATDAIDDVGI
jgi:hypothetical protein